MILHLCFLNVSFFFFFFSLKLWFPCILVQQVFFSYDMGFLVIMLEDSRQIFYLNKQSLFDIQHTDVDLLF